MVTAQAMFAVELCGGATGSDVTRSDVSHVTGSDVSQVIGSDVNHVPYLEVCSAHVQP
jgi:hypothetical protein